MTTYKLLGKDHQLIVLFYPIMIDKMKGLLVKL